MKANVKLDHEPVADGGWLLRALLTIEGDARPSADRTPLNLSLVLDRSGSMAGPSLAAVKEAATMLVKRLAPTDTLSVVAYDGEITVVAPPATGAEQPHLVGQIEAIHAGGSTNLSGGWLQGRKFVAERARGGAVNRILLLTDGLANAGITDPQKLVGLCGEAASQGVTTTTIGFGPHYDEQLLSAMADAGGGSAYYIEAPDQAQAVFEEELRGLLSIAAQNVRVEITTASGTESCRVLHSYPSLLAGGVLGLQVGDLYAREPRPVLAEFLLKPAAEDVPGAGVGAEIPVGTLVIMADVLTAAGGVEEREIVVPIRLSPVEGGIAEPEVRRELTLLDAAKERERALEARTEAERSAATRNLAMMSHQLRSIDPDDSQLAEEASDLDRMARTIACAELGDADRKYNAYRARYAGRGRMDAVESVSREKWEKRRRDSR
jgi:Ca-activated chloride channel family protein